MFKGPQGMSLAGNAAAAAAAASAAATADVAVVSCYCTLSAQIICKCVLLELIKFNQNFGN